MRAIVWMSEPLSRRVCEVVPSESARVSSVQKLVNASREPETVGFIDRAALKELAGHTPGPVVAICEEPLQTAIGWLTPNPWLSHVVSASMLQHPLAKEHFANVLPTLTKTSRPRLLDWFGSSVAGRRVRIAQASKRVERLERMSAFFESKGFGSRTVQFLRDAAEELLTNAFYNAPVAAGLLDKPVSRTQDVRLPDDRACDLVYACRDDLAIVRARDPFGSLSRERIVDVLTRCARTDMKVEVDETMGGAGLGLWRIFSGASFVAVSVVNRRHTEILVGVGKRVAGSRPFAFHLFFREPRSRTRDQPVAGAEST